MTDQSTTAPAVEVDSYNVEIKDDEGFLGDRASKGAFRDILEKWRKPLRKAGNDPFGDEPSEDISKKKLDSLLAEGDPEAAGVLQGAIEDFAQELPLVIRRFLKLKAWRDTERIVVGGGFRASRVGELAIGRAAVILKADKVTIDLVPIRNDPDEAGLIGAAHLAPPWMFEAHDAILGGRHRRHQYPRRRGRAQPEEGAGPLQGFVWKFELWRYADEKDVKRDEAVEKLIKMLQGLIARPERKEKLAPFIGIGCPGLIEADGTIERGAQNLPGNWESSRFNLPLACTRRSRHRRARDRRRHA